MKIKFTNANLIDIENNSIVNNAVVEYDNGEIGINKNSICEKLIDCKNNVIMPRLVNYYVHNKILNDSLIESLTQNGISELLYFGKFKDINLIKYNKENIVINVAINVNNIFLLNHESLNEIYTKIEKDFVPFIYISDILKLTDDEYCEIIKFIKLKNCFVVCRACENLNMVGTCDKETNLSPIQYLDSYGMFDLNCFVTPVTSLDKDDISLLKQNNVKVILNVSHDCKIGSGIAPLAELINNNVDVKLGTSEISILNELRLAVLFQNAYLCNTDSIASNKMFQLISNKLGYDAGLLIIENLCKNEKFDVKDFIFCDNKKILFNATKNNILFNNLN